MTVSARERRHFEAIRKAKDAERLERQREALRRSPIESMREGLALGDVGFDPHVEERSTCARSVRRSFRAGRARSACAGDRRAVSKN